MLVPHGYHCSGVGGLRQLPRVCTHTHTGVHTQTHAEQITPPPQPSAGTPSPPVLWGASTVPGKRWGMAGVGREPFGVVSGLLAPTPPHSLAMQEGAGGQPQAGHPGARRWKGCCGRQRLLGVLGGRRCAGAQRVLGAPWGAGLEQHAVGEWPHKNTCHAGSGGGGAQASAKTGISPPNSVPGPPTQPWGIPELGCHPRPGRRGRLPFM